MEVAVLGCGPAGLLAAEALVQNGHEPVIYSRKVKSQMFGAMFLHAPIPDVTPLEPEFNIDIIKTGTKEGYAKNVYGDPSHPVSWDLIPDNDEQMRGWNLRAAYDRLWDRHQHLILDQDLDRTALLWMQEKYPIIYSSIPVKSYCAHVGHEFKEQKIWVVHGDGSEHMIEGVNDHDIMYYNGYPEDGSVDGVEGFSWYRYSQINKYQCWEHSREPQRTWIEGWYQLSEGIKPISTTCTCFSHFRRIGRFGRWEKGQLTHHAFHQVFEEAAAGWPMGVGASALQ